MVVKPSLSYLLRGRNTWSINKPKGARKTTTNLKSQIWDVYVSERGQTEDMEVNSYIPQKMSVWVCRHTQSLLWLQTVFTSQCRQPVAKKAAKTYLKYTLINLGCMHAPLKIRSWLPNWLILPDFLSYFEILGKGYIIIYPFIYGQTKEHNNLLGFNFSSIKS